MTNPKYMRPGVPFALGKLVEEIGEVGYHLTSLQFALTNMLTAIGKTQRFGLESVNPELPVQDQQTNADWLYDTSVEVREAMAEFAASFPLEFGDLNLALLNLVKEMTIYTGEMTREQAEARTKRNPDNDIGIN